MWETVENPIEVEIRVININEENISEIWQRPESIIIWKETIDVSHYDLVWWFLINKNSGAKLDPVYKVNEEWKREEVDTFWETVSLNHERSRLMHSLWILKVNNTKNPDTYLRLAPIGNKFIDVSEDFWKKDNPMRVQKLKNWNTVVSARIEEDHNDFWKYVVYDEAWGEQSSWKFVYDVHAEACISWEDWTVFPVDWNERYYYNWNYYNVHVEEWVPIWTFADTINSKRTLHVVDLKTLEKSTISAENDNKFSLAKIAKISPNWKYLIWENWYGNKKCLVSREIKDGKVTEITLPKWFILNKGDSNSNNIDVDNDGRCVYLCHDENSDNTYIWSNDWKIPVKLSLGMKNPKIVSYVKSEVTIEYEDPNEVDKTRKLILDLKNTHLESLSEAESLTRQLSVEKTWRKEAEWKLEEVEAKNLKLQQADTKAQQTIAKQDLKLSNMNEEIITLTKKKQDLERQLAAIKAQIEWKELYVTDWVKLFGWDKYKKINIDLHDKKT